jgi:hypothetical protein
VKLWVPVAVVVALVALAWFVVLPRAWSSPALAPVALDADPVQEPLEAGEPLTVERSGTRYLVHKQFSYEVQGEVLSASTYDVTWTNDFADVDLALLWGPKREAIKERFKFFQMGRWLFWRTENEVSAEDRAELTRLISNNHLIPAEGSRHLGWAFRRLGKGDQVRLKGSLVRITSPEGNLYAQSSTSRDDTGDGACEVIWVDELQVNGRVYR